MAWNSSFMTAEGCRLFTNIIFNKCLWFCCVFFLSWKQSIIKIKCMYMQTNVYVHSLRETVRSHIIVGRWHSCSQMATTSLSLPSPRRTYRTFLFAHTKVAHTTLQGKTYLWNTFKGFFYMSFLSPCSSAYKANWLQFPCRGCHWNIKACKSKSNELLYISGCQEFKARYFTTPAVK